MPSDSSARITANSTWTVKETNSGSGRRRAGAAATADSFLQKLTAPAGIEIRHTLEAKLPPRRAAGPLPALDLDVTADPAAKFVLALRHQSGALTFHTPAEPGARRGAAPRTNTVRFQIDFPQEDTEEVAAERRGVISKAIKGAVIAVSGPIADFFLPRLVKALEERLWKDRRRGWLQVTQKTLGDGHFDATDFRKIQSASDRCLLLIHGTFSNTAGGFGDLAKTTGRSGATFLSSVQPIYGDRIFAFNHFSLSKTPEENAKDLLSDLPKQATFDVVTHSRGGLVLRTLVERQSVLGFNAGLFQLGKAVLVASPNHGTPLATPASWERSVGWLSNLAELFPDNPVTGTLEFLSEALIWLAHRASGGIPGIGAMAMDNKSIIALNAKAPAQAGSYSALVSNFQPESSMLLRLADAGFNTFFRGACDLVVPSEGGWHAGPGNMAAAQIGCFGNGGNVPKKDQSDPGVFHTQFFSRSSTVDFLVEALEGRQHAIEVIDPQKTLPARGLRGAAAATGIPAGEIVPAATIAAAEAAEDVRRAARTEGHVEADEIFKIFLIATDSAEEEALRQAWTAAHEAGNDAGGQASSKTADTKALVDPRKTRRTAMLIASFRNSLAVERVVLRQGSDNDQPDNAVKTATRRAQARAQMDATPNWNRIIARNEDIKGYIDGKEGAKPLPVREDLKKFGVELFSALFPKSILRLYDVARAEVSLRGNRLGIVMTSMVNWVADKPWEFAYDPNRQAFLSCEDTNFTRNVVTGVPSDAPQAQPTVMRILVVVAQPLGLGLLSTDEEKNVIERGFRQLIDAGLAEVEIMLSATADLLHKRLEFKTYDVVHFIGHGEFENGEGYLLFEDRQGAAQRVSAENLRQILCHRDLRLVFLNACETGMVGRSEDRFDFNRGVAPRLVAGGVPAVVANQYKVLDVSATEFARRFYWSLARGRNVGDAAREARVAVNYLINGECIDWAVPVVYARNPSQPLFAAREPRVTVSPPTPAGGAARAAVAIRVGLWDVNHSVPALEEIVSRFNTVQKYYHFEVADISAPLGTWRMVHDKKRSVQSISGEDVARKLGGQVTAMGCKRVVALTSFALSGNFSKEGKIGDLAMWNNDPSQRITIVSGAGGLFEAMYKSKAEFPVGRFLANTIANAFCGIDDCLSKTPPRTCPNYFELKQKANEARLQYVAGRQKFCEPCRKAIKPKDNEEALRSLLEAY
jgi:hypothetical protein